MKVKIKKLHPNAVIPKYAKSGDVGMDLVATSRHYDPETETLLYGTDIVVEIPEGYVGLVFPRSSIYKQNGRQSNAVGVIDSSYRGPLMVKHDAAWHECYPHDELECTYYNIGDRVAQLIILPYPQIEFEEVEELSETERGTDGFGSTNS